MEWISTQKKPTEGYKDQTCIFTSTSEHSRTENNTKNNGRAQVHKLKQIEKTPTQAGRTTDTSSINQ